MALMKKTPVGTLFANNYENFDCPPGTPYDDRTVMSLGMLFGIYGGETLACLDYDIASGKLRLLLDADRMAKQGVELVYVDGNWNPKEN